MAAPAFATDDDDAWFVDGWTSSRSDDDPSSKLSERQLVDDRSILALMDSAPVLLGLIRRFPPLTKHGSFPVNQHTPFLTSDALHRKPVARALPACFVCY